METALISVIVPVYNVAQYLEKSIASIQKQTYQNLESFLLMMEQRMKVVACVIQSLNKMTGCQYFIKRMKDCHKHEMME